MNRPLIYEVVRVQILADPKRKMKYAHLLQDPIFHDGKYWCKIQQGQTDMPNTKILYGYLLCKEKPYSREQWVVQESIKGYMILSGITDDQT